jgi:hypothetical protein
MKQLTENDRLEIEKIAIKFTSNTLGNECPKGKCFTICYPLSLHLINNGVENSIRVGKFKDTIITHFWLNLEDDNETIIDPTIKQFYENMPLVYIGKKPEDYHECPKFCFKSWCKTWMERLLNNGSIEQPPYGLPEQIIQQVTKTKLDIKIYLKINYKAAIILNSEIEQMTLKKDFIQSDIFKEYFDYIYEVINCNKNKVLNEQLKTSLPKEFDRLLLKAKINQVDTDRKTI